MKSKKLVGVLISVCLLIGTNCITSFASEAGTSQIQVYEKNEVNTRTTTDERVLLDTFTVSISADGSVKEVNANQLDSPMRIEDPVVASFMFMQRRILPLKTEQFILFHSIN